MIGVFFGDFDPVHDGQILFAQTAVDQYALDKVWFVAKSETNEQNQASLKDRQQMLRLALESYPNLDSLDSSEIINQIDQVATEMSKKQADKDAAYLMGANDLEQLMSSKDEKVKQLLLDNSFIVALLSEDDGEIVIPWAAKEGIEVEFLPSPLSSVSSKGIRQSLKQGETAKGLDDDVSRYINSNGLYR